MYNAPNAVSYLLFRYDGAASPTGVDTCGIHFQRTVYARAARSFGTIQPVLNVISGRPMTIGIAPMYLNAIRATIVGRS